MHDNAHASRQEILLGIIAAILVLLIVLVSLAVQFYRAWPVHTVKCTVTNVARTDSRASDGTYSWVHNVHFTGPVNGQFRTLFPFLHASRSTVTIFCNAATPGVIVDPFILEITVCAMLIAVLVLVCCIGTLRRF